jgi:capsule polysaccharide export protein KpsE/RkpR
MRNRILALGVVTLLAVAVVYAGGDHAKGSKMDPAAKAAWMQKELGLTDAQTAQVKALIENTNKRIADLKAQGLEEDAFKAEKSKIKAEHNAQLKTILTADQWVKYEEMHKQPEKTAKKE